MNTLLSILITLSMGLFAFITFILNQYKKDIWNALYDI